MLTVDLFKASNVEEAVELAARFQHEGRYNWFRGQVREWPPYSSLLRVQTSKDLEAEMNARRRVAIFLTWLKRTPELKEMFDNPDAANAVMQHYGIPTHYIDFTTEPGVAGFFAADTKGPIEAGANACIYCLKTPHLLEVWRAIREFRAGAHLELVTIDVSNLWRLEAQHGVFLFCDYNWDVDYPMDRIVFLYSGYPSWPTKEVIYPPQKSALEQLLDQYFDVEQKTLAEASLREQLGDLKAKGARHVLLHDWEVPPDRYYSSALRVSELQVLASWNEKILRDWRGIASERMEDTIAAPITLQVQSSGSSAVVANSVAYGIRQVLTARPHLRMFVVGWQCRGLTVPEGLAVDEMSRALQAVWNGMRGLPYTDDEIAHACGVTTHLFLEGFGVAISREVAAKVLGDCFQVEFGNEDGSSSRGFVTYRSFRAAIRTDITELANEHLSEQIQKDIKHVLLGIFSPRRLLEFDSLRAIFARELIPTQVLSRKLVLYSPARLDTFGLP